MALQEGCSIRVDLPALERPHFIGVKSIREYQVTREVTYKETLLVVVEGRTEQVQKENIQKEIYHRKLVTEREEIAVENTQIEKVVYRDKGA